MRGRTPQRPASRTGPAPPAVAPAPGLAQQIGNRAFARTLSRRYDRPVTVYLVGSPPPVHASKRATPENKQLAAYIDEVEKLSPADLRSRREAEAAAALDPSGTDQARHELILQAIEFIAHRRGIGGMTESYPTGVTKNPTRMRMNVRVMLEAGIKETGSFEEALDRLPDNDVIAPYAKHFKAEGAKFGKEFTTQARWNAKRMLLGSKKAIEDMLASYGIAGWRVGNAANRFRRGADLDALAKEVVEDAAGDDKVNDTAPTRKRRDLAVAADAIKKQQKLVADLHTKANKADMNRPPDTSSPRWKEAQAAHAELAAAQRELQTLWITTERANPVLASIRRGGDIEKANLGDLDSHDPMKEMRAVVKEVIPKYADIVKAYELIFDKKDVSPLTIPSVVALTRANMFIPRGTIRDGIVNDLVKDAAGGESWLVKIGLIALALVTLLPSGGTSLAIASVAGLSYAAYGAGREWDEYAKQKVFANTDLDLARSLSTEEPSLTKYALSLVGLGLEALPLVQAFTHVRDIKRALAAGEDTTEAVKRLNAIGETKRTKGLGEQVRRDLEAEQGGAKVANRTDDLPHTTRPAKDPHKPAVTTLLKPVGALHGTVAEFRAAVKKRLAELTSGTGKSANGEWIDLVPVIKDKAVRKASEDVFRDLGKVFAAVRNPQKVEDAMVAVWEYAALNKLSMEEALVRMVGGRGRDSLPKMTTQLTPAQFKPYLDKTLPFLDTAFEGSSHGMYAHVFQELLVARELGSVAAARAFRKAIGKAVNPVEHPSTRQPFWAKLWDALFDSYDSKQLNSPEGFGPVLHEVLGLPIRP